jgi:RNA-directed DNA polymerase
LKETKKCTESRQLHIEDFVRKSRVELEDSGKVPSISLTSDMKQNDRSVYTSDLLKKIINGNNMQEAYKRVLNRILMKMAENFNRACLMEPMNHYPLEE